MADRLEAASAWLDSRQNETLSRTVTYRRGIGGSTVEVLATLGKTDYTADTGAGVLIRSQQRDYLIKTADLVLDSVQTLPEVGDFIEDGNAAWEVRPMENQPHYRFSDPYQQMLRIHVNQIEIA